MTQEARARAHACGWQRRQCKEGLRAAAAQAMGNQGSVVAYVAGGGKNMK